MMVVVSGAVTSTLLTLMVLPVLYPALLTNFRLRPTMHRTRRCFLASGCSTYCRVRVRAPRVANPTGHGASPPS